MSLIPALSNVLLNTILPIFLIIGATILVARRMTLDVRTLSRLSIYLLSPALFLSNLSQTEMETTAVTAVVVAAAFFCLLMAGLGALVARLLRLERRLASSFILVAFIMNSVNFGFPFLEFALGVDALETAVIFTGGQAVTAYLLGTYVASRGEGTARQAIRNVLTIPLPYVFVTAMVINASDVTLPMPLMRAIDVMARAIVPVALVILGLQLSQAQLNGRWKPILAASATRFGLGTAVALAVALLFGLQGMTRQVFILEASMPAGVLSGVLTAEFGGDPQFTSATILFTTLLGTIYLSGLLLVLT